MGEPAVLFTKEELKKCSDFRAMESESGSKILYGWPYIEDSFPTQISSLH